MSGTDSATAKLFLVAHVALTHLAESSGRCNRAKQQPAADAVLNAMIKAATARWYRPQMLNIFAPLLFEQFNSCLPSCWLFSLLLSSFFSINNQSFYIFFFSKLENPQ